MNKKDTPKQKQYFEIKLEALVPTILIYRIYADDEQDAIAQMNKKSPMSVRPNIIQKRDIKATVYDAGSSMIKFIKSFRV